MGLQRDRTREGVKGLANLWVRELSPNLETAYTDIGWLSEDGTTIDPQAQVIEHKDEGGNLSKISVGETSHKFSTFLAQVGQDEIDFIKNSALKTHSLRYYGMMNPWRFQYKCAELAQIVPYIPRTWKAGKQNLPLTAFFLKQDNSVFDTPEYYDAETFGPMYLDKNVLWISPRRLWNDATSRILDISGFANHGVLSQTSGGIAGIWQTATTPIRFLRFGGADGMADFGNVCDPTVNSWALDFWVRIEASDGTLVPLITKAASSSSVGFWIERGADNKIYAHISDGSTAKSVASYHTVTQGVWTHVFVSYNIIADNYMKLVTNGDVTNQTQVAIGSQSSLTNTVHLYIGRGGATYGQADFGDARFHISSTDISLAYMAPAHYAAERSIYGV
jgi:hypothetical protein